MTALEAPMTSSSADPGLATLLRGMVLGFSIAVVDRLRARFDARGLIWMNRVSGAIIAVFGVRALLSLAGGKP